MSIVTSISQNVIEKVERMAKLFNVDETYVMSIYNKYAMSGLPEKVALLKTRGDVEVEFGNIASNAPTMYAYVLNDYGPSDIFELMRNKSKRLFDDPNTKEKAIEDEMVNYEGVPLDYRKNVFGKPNEAYGTPLEGSLWQREIKALVSKTEDFASPTLVSLTADKDFAKELPTVEPFKFYAFRGNVNTKNPNKVRISNGTKFRTYASKVTVAEMVNKLPITELKDVELEYKENFAGKQNNDYLAVIRGNVIWMNLTPIMGNRTFIIVDESMDTQMRCKLSEKIDITFKQTDDVVLFTRLFPGKDGKIGAQVRAYLVVPQ